MLKDENKNYVKNKNAYLEYDNKISNDAIKLYMQFTNLKNLYRQGWFMMLEGNDLEKRVESVADHSWAVAMLAITTINKYGLDLNVEKCVLLSLIHELGEIYAGDIIMGSIPDAEKDMLESKALDKLFEDVESDYNLKELWNEFEYGLSKEAKFVKELDKLECIMQAVCYGLDAKYVWGEESIVTPCLKEILKEMQEISNNNVIPMDMRIEKKEA